MTGEIATQSDIAAPTDVSAKAIKGVAWMSLQQWLGQAMSLGVFVLLGRLLTPRAFGVVAAAMVVVTFLRVLVDLGLSRALVQRGDIGDEHADTAFWVSVGFGFFLTALVAGLAPLIAQVYHQPALTWVLVALSSICILQALDSVQSALVERAMAFRVQSLRRLAAVAVSSAVAVGLALAGAGVWALVAQALVLEAVTVGLLWTLTVWRPRLRFSRTCLKELLGFGTAYTGTRIVWSVQQNADDFLVGVVLGTVALGYYAVGSRVLVVLSELLTLSINQVALTSYSRLQSSPERMREAFLESVGIASIIGIPANVGLAVLARPLVITFFGPQWVRSVPIMQALAVAGVIGCSSAFNHNLLLASGRVRSDLVWNLCTAIVSIVAFAAAVHFGVTAVAIGFSAAAAAAFVPGALYLGRVSGLRMRAYLSRFLAPLPATAVMTGGLLALGVPLGEAGLPQLVARVVAGVLIYGITLRLVAPGGFRSCVAALRSLRSRPRPPSIRA